jgi:hypothetical protein
VKARNSLGFGDASFAPSLQVPGKPGVPTGVAVTFTGATASVAFTPGATGGLPITDLTATCTSSDGGATRTASGLSSPVGVPSLSAGRTYTCKVVETTAAGTSPVSAPSAAVRVPLALGDQLTVLDPAAREHFTVDVPAGTTFSVAWTAEVHGPDCDTDTLAVTDPVGVDAGSQCARPSDASLSVDFPAVVTVTSAAGGTYGIDAPGSIAGDPLDLFVLAVQAAPTVDVPITAGGAAAHATAVPGQLLRWTFAGTAGEKVSATVEGVSETGCTFELVDDAGTVIGTQGCGGYVDGRQYVAPVFLPGDGTYHLQLHPTTGGPVDVQLFLPADATVPAATLGQQYTAELPSPGSTWIATYTVPDGTYTLAVGDGDAFDCYGRGGTLAGATVYLRGPAPDPYFEVGLGCGDTPVTSGSLALPAGTYDVQVISTAGGAGSTTITLAAEA